jgi:carbonic anhydrase
MPNTAGFHTHSDRRQFLQSLISGAAIGLAARTGIELAYPERLGAQIKLSPDTALQELLEGNQRFAANRLTSINDDLTVLKERAMEKQEPFAAVLACADSRVPVELIFDQTIGHIFVTRVAGNIVTPEIIASLEYSVAILGIKALLVLGHSSCGALKAAMKSDIVPGHISALYPHLRQAVENSAGDLDKAIEANAKIQAQLLRTSSSVVREAITAGNLKLKAGIYDLATGNVTVVNANAPTNNGDGRNYPTHSNVRAPTAR